MGNMLDPDACARDIYSMCPCDGSICKLNLSYCHVLQLFLPGGLGAFFKLSVCDDWEFELRAGHPPASGHEN